MSSVLIEHGQYVDDAGTPISGGKLYVGTQNADPVATSLTTVIYSDRALTIPIANPQSLGTDGRTLSKVWVDGEYSIQVNSLVGIVETQEFQDLDAGTGAAKASTLDVSNVLGVNVITGTTDAALSSLTANQQFIFTTAGENTTNITLNIDGTGARPVVKNYDQPILVAEFEAGQVVIVAYNEISNNFEWVNQNNKVVDFHIAPSVASAATTNIWVTDGNTVHVTGTTGITAFSPAASIGARRTVVFDGIVLLTHSADLSLPGGVNYTTVAGDIIEVYADTLTQHDVVIHKRDGTAVVVVPRWSSPVGILYAPNTLYQNTTGKPMLVTFGAVCNIGGIATLRTGPDTGVAVYTSQVGAGSSALRGSLVGLLPPGWWYYLEVTGVVTFTVATGII